MSINVVPIECVQRLYLSTVARHPHDHSPHALCHYYICLISVGIHLIELIYYLFIIQIFILSYLSKTHWIKICVSYFFFIFFGFRHWVCIHFVYNNTQPTNQPPTHAYTHTHILSIWHLKTPIVLVSPSLLFLYTKSKNKINMKFICLY